MQHCSQPLPLGFALVEVTRLLRSHIDRAFESAGLGLTVGEARTLAYADQYPGLRQSALAERIGVEPMTLVAYLDRLEAHGLVRREPDPTDRRAKIVVLTEAAGPAVRRIHRLATEARREATRGLSDEQIETLREILGQMRGNLARRGEEVPA
ncbi:MarR family winged helix-turn-helix transcriptional regulator [Lutibaculum baratangense]|uniref:Transcriptional regulator, MarR family n=1 Tax=Lutibaculum baratangense AMV1 TaxID=631454 RepID=V4R0V5_9HYPH|nr:MarR family transcriptional regulator [Lutibaculum baratangense]ESR25637.1 Transcriptional regulator, MarR family [Lutibaculum baratangense AMV1]